MNIRFSPILSVAVIFTVTLPVLADQWVRVISDNDDNVYFLDKASITGSDRYRRYWDAIVYNQPQKGVYKSIFYNSVDCKTGLLRVRQIVEYDSNNKIISETNDGGDGELIDARQEFWWSGVKLVCGIK